MHALAQFVKEGLLPGSLPFLLLGLALGVAALHRARLHRLARWWLVVFVAGYWAISLPVGARLLVALLVHGIRPVESRAVAADATAIVVLDGGTSRFGDRDRIVETVNRPSAYRALEAARVYRLLDRPWVIVSGGTDRPVTGARPDAALLCEEIVRAGVPADRVVLDSGSLSTRQSAVNLVRILRARSARHFVLVTSATHIRRALLAFAGTDLRPTPSPSAEFDADAGSWRNWWPSLTALEVSASALREALAIPYYWVRGWLAPVPASSDSPGA